MQPRMLLVLLAALHAASATVFLKEQFSPDWDSRWVVSAASKDGVDQTIAKYDGEWVLEGKNESAVLVTSVANKHYGISVPFSKVFDFKAAKPLVLQYEVRFQQRMSCGGAYVKLLSDGQTPLNQLVDKTPYTILFGPDKCGADSKLLFIYRFKNPVTGVHREVHAKPVPRAFDLIFSDDRTHLLTLVIKPDNTFEIKVDTKKVASGSLESSSAFDPALEPPVEVDDPTDSKPADWVDEKTIVDPTDSKPEDWDETQPPQIDDDKAEKPHDWDESAPEYIADPSASKPVDWDDDMDGVWEAPLVPNPACEQHGCGEWVRPTIRNPLFKGKWHPRTIENPAYKGEWAPRRISNPDHFTESSPFAKLDSIRALALELWTITSGISFSNILVTDDVAVAEQFAAETWPAKKALEDSTRPSEGGGVLAVLLGWYEEILEAVDESPYLLVVLTAVAGLPIVVLVRCCVGGGSAGAPTITNTTNTNTPTTTKGDNDDEDARSDEPTPVADERDEPLEGDNNTNNITNTNNNEEAQAAQEYSTRDLVADAVESTTKSAKKEVATPVEAPSVRAAPASPVPTPTPALSSTLTSPPAQVPTLTPAPTTAAHTDSTPAPTQVAAVSEGGPASEGDATEVKQEKKSKAKKKESVASTGSATSTTLATPSPARITRSAAAAAAANTTVASENESVASEDTVEVPARAAEAASRPVTRAKSKLRASTD